MNTEKSHLKFKIFKFLPVVFIFYFLLFVSVGATHAENFRNDYQVEYFLSETQNTLNTSVKFTITITNLVADLYVKKFTIGFPASFQIKNIRGYDDRREISPHVESTQDSTKITLEFSDPEVGKNSANTLYLEFNQDNLFKVNGNIWEVILPTVENKESGFYKILLHLPPDSTKKISISKPTPDSISGSVITWNNPAVKTIYAVFGDIQYYQADLTYHVKNTKLIPVYTDIAFPPDTQTQKIFVQSIKPTPVQITIDPDGNYMGRYFLQPKENLTVSFSGIIAEYAKVREEVIPYIRARLSAQKNYLLQPQDLWSISSQDKIRGLNSEAKDIYQFVSKNLKYDYDKINSDNKRLGAEGALNNPTRAVCMEFTDLFVGIARQRGLYTREIEGFGFTEDPKLRPLSLTSDILHSWPEYYDVKSKLWIPVDPTWENTSGIDYFSSFDLNHITFAIHGKNPNYPLPAGTYKTGNSRDVSINPTSVIPKENEYLTVTNTPFAEEIDDFKTYQAKIEIRNEGNIYYWGKGINIISDGIEVTPVKSEIAPLAPYGKTTIFLRYKAKNKVAGKSAGNVQISLPDGRSITAHISIVPFYYILAINMSIALGISAFIILVFLYIKRRRNLAKLA